MRIPFKEYQRRAVIPVAGLVLAGYYLFFMRPLAQRAENLEKPLQEAWHQLLVSLDQTNAKTVDFRHITNQLSETRQALQVLDNARQQAIGRLQLAPLVRARIQNDFQLVDYENERGKQLEDLSKLAKQQKVTIAPAVFGGFPEHTADVKQPALLWAALALTDGLLRTAIQCQLTAIHSLGVTPVLTNAAPTNGFERLVAMPVQIEFTSSAASAGSFLQCLPLRAEEIQAAGLLKAPVEKPVLFIDRLLVQKQSPEKPDDVHVWLRVVGLVLRE